jgi:hypothetical protein
MAKLIVVRQKWLTGNRLSRCGCSVKRPRCQRQPIHRPTAKTQLMAYFLHLRATLDREHQPTLLVDQRLGYILAINLPTFELLKIDAVGLSMLDFAADRATYAQIGHQLQQTGKSHQTILLYNADGGVVTCQAQAEIAPNFAQWAVWQLKADQ